jgi:hypothetical protein
MTGFAGWARGHEQHLLKTTETKVAEGRRKSKCYLGLKSLEESKPAQILFGPACVGEHSAKRADRKRVTQGVIGNDHATTVGSSVNAMTSAYALKHKTVSF